MKRFALILTSLALFVCACSPENTGKPVTPVTPSGPDGPVTPVMPARTGESCITYQLLVYSFADSDGDGIGDFNGIREHLDYFKSLGVQSLWLSPIHPATSYHGYDVEDYYLVNPKYGTEEDFKSLLSSAHSKGIKVYIDYVLNHSSREHPWFIEGKSNPDSKYRGYYHFSTTAKSGYSQTVSGTDPGKINVRFTLKCNSFGTPQTLKAEKVESVPEEVPAGSGKFLWYGSVTESTMPEFNYAGNDTYILTVKDFETSWGVLVRTSKSEWGANKFGAASSSEQKLVWGVPFKLKSNSDYDILMPWMGSIWYQSVFGFYMPDINYGPAETCEHSDAFKDVCAAADKWIRLGVDGFRLDAVKHIYDNDRSDENPIFLKKFYDHCNATFKACGHSENIYMVGEQWSEPGLVAPYYKGLNAFFEFAFWDRLKDSINSGNGKDFAQTIIEYHGKYTAVRPDAIAATKLTNHDEDRAAEAFGKNANKMKLAAAVLLTSGGEPYIYQGEELGYWGTKAGGDVFVRTPILWTSDIASAAAADLDGNVDYNMLSAGISVESQSADEGSVLQCYRKFGELRDCYPALAKGTFVSKNTEQNCISAWYRETADQKILVLHNFGGDSLSFDMEGDSLAVLIGSNGNVDVKGTKLTLGAYSSALFLQ